ncbi:MFS transporter [Rhodopseudomonas sp. B29]|uniref:MFS transporter n=1 Tax=Rhodopseudomonas sp. B29 TaxID=95607 RepID=UPI00034C17F0|nr:MFS transporter [Rhodopseudomonas sp. B29]
MISDSQIPTSPADSRHFAARLALFYGATFSIVGTYLPFFTVWLKAIGIEAFWIGAIVAVPAVTRFTILPMITAQAERRNVLRAALISLAFVTAIGFTCLGFVRGPLLVLLVFALTACAWTPMVPLTDGYALKAVARLGLNYGPLRLWGSASFVFGAIISGVLADVIAANQLIFVVAGAAWLGALSGFALPRVAGSGLQAAVPQRRTTLLRDRRFLLIIAAAAMIQGSHAAYYTFASIVWRGAGLGGSTIAGLWILGVLAEIVVFALSPRFTLAPSLLMLIGAIGAVLRWLIMAHDPPLAVLTGVQLLHGCSFGLTQLGTMGLLLRNVPTHVMARGQGYLTAATGLMMSSGALLSGAVFERGGVAVYYVAAAMALGGAMLIGSAARDLNRSPQPVQPHSAGAGG